ncbi:hypothetical protein EXIGLDRAFT_720589, partial [Exidia glandulosa HHB12029]
LVTSSLFMPSVLALLSPQSQSALMRCYVAITLGYWVSRGRPPFPIAEFYEHVTAEPSPPVAAPKPNPQTLDKENIVQNPWFNVLQSTVAHPDEHLLKLQRSLAHYGMLYGDRTKGHWTGTEVEGAELLDGSVFVRVAGASLERHGPVREGAERGGWDRNGFFDL